MKIQNWNDMKLGFRYEYSGAWVIKVTHEHNNVNFLKIEMMQ